MPRQIALEFKRSSGEFAALGTDTLVTLDMRWGPFNTAQHIYGEVARLRHTYPEKYSNLWFVGYNVMGMSDYRPDRLDVRMSDRTPPSWVTAGQPLEKATGPQKTEPPAPTGMSVEEMLEWLGTYAQCPEFADTPPADLRELAGLPPETPDLINTEI
jgi:hypothetical protein